MNTFLQQLDTLTETQREAVTHDLGPLLIVAGAGTGKTKVITSRIGFLLLEKKVPSKQILALTFTEKAMEEMTERVDMLMPLGYEEIWIKTFHGFCDQILRERGHEIGIDPGYKLFTNIDQWLLLKKNLFALELDYYRPLGNPSKFFSALLSYFSRLKDEYVSPEEFSSYARLLPESDEIQQEEKKKMMELAHIYETYQHLMMQEGAMDFGDLIFYTLKLLKTRPSVLREYQDRFRYIMVDEFQDTNFAQTELVFLLGSRDKNVVVVGDDDQAIYRFRGASLSNMMAFEKAFPDAKKIVLTQNFRSHQAVLDSAYGLIQNNNPDRLEHRAQISKRLVAARIDLEEAAEPPVSIWHFQNFLQEVRAVCDHIVKHVDQKSTLYNHFAILARSNQQLKPFVEELKARKIPYQIRTPEGIFSLEEVKDLIAILRVVCDPHDNVAMYRVLTLDIFGIAMSEIVDLFHHAKKDNASIFDRMKALAKEAQGAIPGMEQSFLKVHALVQELIDFSRNRGVLALLIEFLHRSQYLPRLLNNQTGESIEKVQNLHRFSRFVEHFEKTEIHRSLPDFIEYIDLLEEANEQIGFHENTASDFDAVQLITVHSSKGLEFPTVFLVSMVHNRFPSIAKKDTIEVPEALVKETVFDKDIHAQEERRLMYVACTRARDHLILTHSDMYEGKKQWKPSVFLEEIAQTVTSLAGEIVPQVQRVDFSEAAEKSSVLTKQYHLPMGSDVRRIHKPVRKLSYSQFDTFQTCPLKYRYRYLVSIPTPTASAANFGSSVHGALDLFYKALKRGETVDMALLNSLYDQQWIPYGYDSKAHENAQKKKGREMLHAFYEKNSVPQFVVPYALEKNFSLKIGDFTVSGRIDRIDRLEDGTYEVIDYKTGSSKRDANLTKDLQLSIYALACRDIFGIPVSKLSLYFLADQEKNSTTRNDEQIEQTKADLLEIALELQKSDFQPMPGFHCQYCEFRLVCPAV